MTQTDWHASQDLLERFVRHPAAVDDMTAASLEAHLIGCASCRGRLRATASADSLALSWDAVADRIDRPRVSLGERFFERLGMSGGMARLVAATPALRFAGLIAVALVSAAAAALSRSADAEGPFLVLAPLAPLAMVAMSFAPAGDPAGEARVATPLYGAGLVVRRAVAILVVSFGFVGLATLALPELGIEAAGWVLPSLALCLGSLSLATWVPTEVAVAILASGWLMTVSILRWYAGTDVPYAASPTFSLAGQVTAAIVAVIAAALLVVRRDRFATLEALR